MTLLIPHFIREPKYVCRACPARFYEGEERQFAAHTRRCADDFMERKRVEREPLRDLECRDPEYQAWAEQAYRQGRLKPSTDPV